MALNHVTKSFFLGKNQRIEPHSQLKLHKSVFILYAPSKMLGSRGVEGQDPTMHRSFYCDSLAVWGSQRLTPPRQSITGQNTNKIDDFAPQSFLGEFIDKITE